jgi:hypothetical protein
VKRGTYRGAVRRGALVAALGAACLGAAAPAAVDRMLRPVIEAPAATAQIVLDRSDPFGGPPERTTGRVWYQPGRGLRVRFDRGGGEELVADRRKGALFLYRPSEKTVYRAPWERTPARLRRLVEEPSRILESDLGARPAPCAFPGSARDGQRLRATSLGDSSAAVSLWIGPDPRSGRLRWISIAAPEDTVWIELRNLALHDAARDRDLALSAPRGTPVEPMDPREMLPGGDRR